ncbi:MAG: DEAD/DEAH box helicase [Bdellovibrionales bacterium]
MKFSEIQLHPALQANLDKIQFVECTQIQEQGIPWIRKGKDIAGLAQTGTGKTGAFLVPLVDRILKSVQAETSIESDTVAFPEWKKRQYVLVLVPTRELAEQVEENAKKFLDGTGMASVAVYGGTSYDKQKAGIKAGVEFVIATPGRLIDLYKEHIVDLGLVRAVVFDEADRMFDMGFKDDMKFILRRLPRDRQFLVFSATLNFDVLNTAYEFGADPVEINISRDQAKAENVKDFIFHIGQDEKPAYLLSLLKKYEPRQAIIFSNFKHNVERITRFLNDNQVPAVGISSLLTQGQRNRVMEQFKGSSDRNIMVATDLAARGLDILGVDLVMNFELPDDPENYVHRIGRTGRAGQTGTALSMVSDRDVDALQRIEEYLKHKVESLWLEESEIQKDYSPFPRDENRFGKKPSFRSGASGGGGRDRGPGGRGGGGGRDRDRDRGRGPGGRGGGGRDRDRDRGPRRDRNFNRGPQQDRPLDENQLAATGTEGAAGSNETHRDRHRGRHGGDRDQQGRRQGGHDSSRRHGSSSRQGSRDNQDSQPRRHGSGENQEARHGGRPQGGRHRDQHGGRGRRPDGRRHGHSSGGGRSSSAPMAAKSAGAGKAGAGIGSKVTGFFKKLFGKAES